MKKKKPLSQKKHASSAVGQASNKRNQASNKRNQASNKRNQASNKHRFTPHASKKHGSQTRESHTNEAQGFYSHQRLTIYGRNPVLEALSTPSLTPQKLFLSYHAQGEKIQEIIEKAKQIALPIHKLSPLELSRISKNSKQDQGVALDLYTPHIKPLAQALQDGIPSAPIFVLDRIQTPGNLGMIIRSLCAAEVAGIVLPKRGGTTLNPLSIKASAGVAFKAHIWTCDHTAQALELLSSLQWPIYGLSSHGEKDLYQTNWSQQSIWIIGNESQGIDSNLKPHIHDWVKLSMSNQVESLNAAVSAALVAFELRRQNLYT